MKAKTMLEIIDLKRKVEITMRETDLIVRGTEPHKAVIQARRWFDIKQRRRNADKSGS